MDEAATVYVGKGWNFPPRFGKHGSSVRMVEGREEVEQGIEILLRTQLGERFMHQDFGCSLDSYAFASIIATLLNEIRGNINNTMVLFERRITVNDVQVTQDPNKPELLHIAVDYVVPDSNSRYNRVFPYYLAEAANTEVYA